MLNNKVSISEKEGPSLFSGQALIVNLDWDFPVDLDLAAICRDQDQREDTLVYYGNNGSRAAYPFVHLSHDQAGSNRSKHRQEHMVITNARGNDRIYLFVWNHNAADKGNVADFTLHPDSYEITVTDTTNRCFKLNLLPQENCNCLLFGEISEAGILPINKGCLIGCPETHLKSIRELAGLDEVLA